MKASPCMLRPPLRCGVRCVGVEEISDLLRGMSIYIVRARKGWSFEKVVRILRLDLEIRRELPYLCSRKSGGRAMNDRV